jgi:hypothetical protein
MSQNAVSADIIPNSAVWASPKGCPSTHDQATVYATTALQTGFNLPLYLAPEFIDPVFAKTSQKRLFSGSINSGTVLFIQIMKVLYGNIFNKPAV